MKIAPQKMLGLLACLGMVVVLSGCASNNTACNSRSWMPNNPFQNRPVRNTIKSWFQGDPCNTCNPPVGQTLGFGTNVSQNCPDCDTQYQPGAVDQGVSLYGDPILNGPAGSAVYDQGIQNPAPIYPEAGAAQNGAQLPPQF